MAILLTGELDEDEENPYAEVNWNKIFDNLDDDWIIFTNSGKHREYDSYRLRTQKPVCIFQ
ncbi:MAG: hypothetical protein ACLRR3_01170 [Eubacterium sp.]